MVSQAHPRRLDPSVSFGAFPSRALAVSKYAWQGQTVKEHDQALGTTPKLPAPTPNC